MKKLILIITVGLFMVAGVVLATHTNPNELHACYKNNNGQMRFVSDPANCLSSETAITWDQAGLPGPVGPAGGLSSVVTASTDSAIADQIFAAATAVCPAGRLATGGGWALQGTIGVGLNIDSFLVIANAPTDGTGWQVSMRRSGPLNGRNWGVRTFAICAL